MSELEVGESEDVGAADDAPPSAGGPGRAARLMALAGLVFGGLAVAFVVRTLVHEWPRVSDDLSNADLRFLALAFACAALGMTSIGWAWRSVMQVLGVDAPLSRVIPWYYVGELGKYVPGGIWPVLGRGELARNGGVPRSRAYASVAMSLGVLYLAAMFVAAAFLPFGLSGGTGFSPWMLALLALPVGVVALHHEVLERVVRLVGRLTGRTIDLPIPVWRDSLMLVARYVPTWLFIGTATWAVGRATTTDISYPRVMFATILSWVVGFLAVPVPSGAGIREAVLYATSGLTKSQSVFTAVTARMAFVLVDVLGAAICAPLVRRRTRVGATVGPLPTADDEPQ
ncbi:MAG: lysylphosphatidylglycerol synthase transmembrane domain-containing protein [Acidimicrobiales bacterium]